MVYWLFLLKVGKYVWRLPLARAGGNIELQLAGVLCCIEFFVRWICSPWMLWMWVVKVWYLFWKPQRNFFGDVGLDIDGVRRLASWDCGTIKVCGLEMSVYICMCSSYASHTCTVFQKRAPTVQNRAPKLGRGNWYYAAITNEKDDYFQFIPGCFELLQIDRDTMLCLAQNIDLWFFTPIVLC